MISKDLSVLARVGLDLLDSGIRIVPTSLMRQLGFQAQCLLQLEGTRFRELRIAGGRLAATLLSLEGSDERTPELTRERLCSIADQARRIRALEEATGLYIPAAPDAKVIPFPRRAA